jgi:hypothetical protein
MLRDDASNVVDKRRKHGRSLKVCRRTGADRGYAIHRQGGLPIPGHVAGSRRFSTYRPYGDAYTFD